VTEIDSTELPPQSAFLHAILRHLATRLDGDRRANIHEAMPALLGLTEAQKTARLANLPHLRYRHRSGWGLSMAKAAGYVESAGPGIWKITSRGGDLIAAFPQQFDADTAKRILRESRSGKQTDLDLSDDAASASDSALAATQSSPDERIDVAIKELHRAVAADLLERVLSAPPAFFEELVLDLLHALGYGTSADDLEHVGASGDGGIDGIISLDKLGFEKIYVQAKRWQSSVGRPEIQSFFGALAGRKARKGVFITTSSFTREAKQYGEQISDVVVLIDGALLTSLMIENGIAVTHYRVLRLPRVDGDYFDAG
jgi:restriction system protein